MTYARRRRAAVKRVRAGHILSQSDHDRIPVDYRVNAREALEFAHELRDSHYDDPAERERVLAGVGRLVRWADERMR